MSTIVLYAAQISQMPASFQNLKNSVIDYQTELTSLKDNLLTIPDRICNMGDVISSIQASAQIQERKAESTDLFNKYSEEFVYEVIAVDNKVSDIVSQRKEDFYAIYDYLTSEFEKSWTEKTQDWFSLAGEWCKELWNKAAKNTLYVISLIIQARFFAEGFSISVLKNILEIPMVVKYPSLILDEWLLGGQGKTREQLDTYDYLLERFLMRNIEYAKNIPAFNLGRCAADLVSVVAGSIGMVVGIMEAFTGTTGGIAGAAAGGGPILLLAGAMEAGIGVAVATVSLPLLIQGASNLEKDRKAYWESRLKESRIDAEGGSGTTELKEIYNSIKESPNYPEGFQERLNGTTKHNVNNHDLLEKLREIESGTWKKVYKDGYDAFGNKISIHYFQSQSGKVFDVKIKIGWSN